MDSDDDGHMQLSTSRGALGRELRRPSSGGARVRDPELLESLIAAAAETAGAPVLHYDEGHDRIAEVTGQPVD
jgi:predicted nucleic acid-binding protein